MSGKEQQDTTMTAATADSGLQMTEGKNDEDVTKELLSDPSGVNAQGNENSGGIDSISIEEDLSDSEFDRINCSEKEEIPGFKKTKGK